MNNLLQHSKMFFDRNGATILTCIGGIGAIVTAVMAVKVTPKALTLIEKAKEEKGEELTKMEVIRVAGPIYIPSILMGMSTLACIFGSNMLNKHHQAALISAYAMLDSSYREYRAKTNEVYGEYTEDRIRREIAKDKYEEADICVSGDKQLFFDDFSGRYFESTLEEVIYAAYLLNRDLAKNRHVCLNDFYRYLNIPLIVCGDELGWSTRNRWVDFEYEEVTIDDDLECYILTMKQTPLAK